MKIYISGKITGLDYDEAFAMFEAAEDVLTRLGHSAVNPMKKVSEQEGKSWAEYMKEDIPILLECDGIYLLKNWKESKGARLERHVSHELGMVVAYEDNGQPYRVLSSEELNTIYDATRDQGPDAYGLACMAAVRQL